MPGTGTDHPPAVLSTAPIRAGLLRDARTGLATWLSDPRSIPFGLAAITVLVFSPALLNGFVEWDDSVNLVENPSYRGVGWKQIRWMLTSTLMGHYIPLTWLSFGVDYTVWGMNPLGYHLTSILLHAANTALFYVVALRLLTKATSFRGSGLRLASAVATLFFALHPLRVESVAWATERRDVLSGLFFLLTVLLYVEAADAQGRQRHRLLGASLASYALALLSKSIVMTLPLVLILLDVYPLGRVKLRWAVWREPSARAALKQKLPYVSLGLAGAITSYSVVASHDFVVPLDQYGWKARIAMVGHSLWFYVEKTFLPAALSPLYELPAVMNPLEPPFVLNLIAVVAITGGLLAVRRRWPAGLAAWAYYAISLGPVSGVVQSGSQLTNDRYSYLPCLGWALLAGAAAGSIARVRSMGAMRPWLAGALAATAAVWIFALGTFTWYQVQIWRDSETLWRHAVESEPRCSLCQNNLGSALYDRKLLQLAKERFDLALALRPDRLRAHGGLGLVLENMGDVEGGMRHLGIAVAHYPDDSNILTNMAVALVDQKRHSEAISYLERVTRIHPNHVPALVTLGNALLEIGQPEKALGSLLRALELRPEEPVLRYNLARAHLALGAYGAARKEYDTLLTLDPQRARALEPAFLTVR